LSERVARCSGFDQPLPHPIALPHPTIREISSHLNCSRRGISLFSRVLWTKRTTIGGNARVSPSKLIKSSLRAADWPIRFYFSYNYDITRTLQSNMGGCPRPAGNHAQVRFTLSQLRVACHPRARSSFVMLCTALHLRHLRREIRLELALAPRRPRGYEVLVHPLGPGICRAAPLHRGF
jgi:hypothetical protein